MKANADDFRRLYSNLNDEALLAINRDDLVPVAQECLDAELAERGLTVDAEEEETAALPAPQQVLGEDVVELAVFQNPGDAGMARSLLRSAEIPCALSTDFLMPGSVLQVAPDVILYVPAEFVEAANEILDSEISEEDLAAQAAAAGELEELEDEEFEEEAGPKE
jgi:hypothetical protein